MKSRYLLFILGAILLMFLPFGVKAETPEWVTVTSNPGNTGYSTISGYSLSMIETNQGGAFCVQGEKAAPMAGCVYHRTSIYTEDPGMLWLLGQSINSREDYHTVQGAIYRYIGMKGTDNIFVVNRNVYPKFEATPGSFTHTAAAISLSDQAMRQTSSGSSSDGSNFDFDFDRSTIEQGSEACSGDYIKTRQITITGENVDWDTLTVTALEVPEARMVDKVCSGNSCTFRLEMSLSAAQGHTSLTLVANASTNGYADRYYIYESYSCPQASPQEILFRIPSGGGKTKTYSGFKLNPDACTDYSLDVSCGNCDASGDGPSFIIQDSTNWSGILNSNKSNGNAAGYFDQYGKEGSNGCHVYCREEYRVYFPNEDDQINVDTGRYFTFNLEGDIVIGTVPNYKEVKVEKTKECQATEEYEVIDSEGNTRTEERPSPACMSQYDSSQSTPKAGETGDVTIQYTETYQDSVYNANNPIKLNINESRQETEENVSGSSATYEVTNWYELPTDTYRYIDIQTGESSFNPPNINDKDKENKFRDLETSNLPISYENYGVNIGGENVGAYVGFSYNLPGESNISDAFEEPDNSYFKTSSTSNDNMYTKYVNNGCSVGDDSNLEEELRGSTCAELYGYGTSDFCQCARSKQSNKAGDCIGNINSGLDSNYYQCEVLVCEEGQYVCGDGKCCDLPTDDDTPPGGTPPGGPGDDNDDCDECEDGVCCPGLNMVCPDDNGKCPAPAGGEIIYRTIDLSDPFPGQNAENRRAGWNWCSYDTKTKKFSCAGLGSDNPIVYDHIINNRNVTSENLYRQKQPLYEYTLTHREINAIRDYNNDTDYSDWNMTCSDENGEKVCASNFLNDASLINVSGTCSRDPRIATCAEE